MKLKNHKKSISLLFAVIIVVISSTFITIDANDIDDLQNQLKETENKIDEINNKISKANKEKSSVENEINKLDFQMEKLDLEIQSLNLKIQSLNLEIEDKQCKIQALSDKITERNELLEKRLRVMYKKGLAGYVEVLFDSEDIGDLLTRLDLIQKIVNSDVDLLKSIEDQKSEIKILQMQLESEKNEVIMSMDDVQTKKGEVEIVSRAKENYMLSLEKDIDELKKQEDRFLADSEKLEEQIKKAQLEMQYAGGEMAWPAPGVYRITSPYGMRMHPVYYYWKMHSGIDIGVAYSNLVAANDGVVQFAGGYGAYGNLVIIDHGGGISTVYGHNSKILVSVGQEVSKGEVISISGRSGLATGPHLHFEVRENGVRVDPLNYYKYLKDVITFDI